VQGVTTGSTYVELADQMSLIPSPRLGPINTPGDIRAVQLSTPDFVINTADDRDLIYFSTDCTAFSASNATATAQATSLLTVNSSGTSGTVQIPGLTSMEGASTRTLKACFLPAGTIVKESNVVELQDRLKVIPEPIGTLISSWMETEVTELSFDTPIGHAGEMDDLVVVSQLDCSMSYSLHSRSEFVGIQYSDKTLLEEGGRLQNFRLSQGRIKELPAGTYSVCFATRSSEGDSPNDWKTLATQVSVGSSETEVVTPPPVLYPPESVLLGVDIVVQWDASNDQMKYTTQKGAWIGLYKKGECGVEVAEGRHDCYLAFKMLQEGESSGTVTFTQAEYQNAGEYDVRFMRGDTTNRQGRVCKGITKSPAGVYLYCMVEAAVISDTITVFGNAVTLEDMDSVPGLENIIGLEAVSI
jgi:hypothetical protein